EPCERIVGVGGPCLGISGNELDRRERRVAGRGGFKGEEGAGGQWISPGELAGKLAEDTSRPVRCRQCRPVEPASLALFPFRSVPAPLAGRQRGNPIGR